MSSRGLLRLAALATALAGCTPASGGAQDSGRADPEPLAVARSAMATGLPWRATLTLAPLLQDSSARTPEVELLAAEAAAAWGGWDEVRRLLRGATWLDSHGAGMGHELLARAALEARDDPAAIRHARLAVEQAATGDGRSRGRRLVFLARAHDRADSLAQAAAEYALAAEHLPGVAEWLWLRAAAVTPDPDARRQYLAAVSGPVTSTRVGRITAQGLERAGDSTAAATAWRAEGEEGRALAIEMALAPTRADSVRLRASLVRLVADKAGSSEAERAVGVLDRAFGALTAEEELIVARSAVRSGPRERAEQAYTRAFRADLGTNADRFRHAGLLERLGRYDAAAREYARVEAASSLAPRAAYLRARSLLRDGNLAASRTELRAILDRWPADTAAAISLVLLADLAIDEGRDSDARAAYQRVGEQFPGTWYGPFGLYHAAIIALAQGDTRAAVADFDAVHAKHPSSDEAIGALYWSGRGSAALGDTARAREQWHRVLAAEPTSYYGFLAAARLGEPGWAPAAPASWPPVPPEVTAGLQRAVLLDELGMGSEAQLEHEAILADADASVERQVATGRALVEAGLPWRAPALGWRAVGRGAPRDATTWSIIYPLPQADALMALSTEKGLDPALVAGLIRQESMFNPRATSGAGARGLMQVMPAVGASAARARGFPVWDAALLYQPDVNLDLGTTHLREMTARYPETARVLAAYNAGGTRVARWDDRAGGDDPELFTERIPYKETRDYVRIVQRNRAMYRALYPELSGR